MQKKSWKRKLSHPLEAINKPSYRQALKNHTKKAMTATSTDVNNAGPTHRYFDLTDSSALYPSMFMFVRHPKNQIHPLMVENLYAKRFVPLLER